MAISRTAQTATARFSVGLNAILTGSKKMTPEQQDALMDVGQVRILIVDASDKGNVLVDTNADACEFSTGSVGYKLHLRDVQFASE